MKCRSVACIWAGSPPPHRVTAAAVLHHPPTLYTGGADGSIIWWTFSGDDSDPEIKPMAMLCGHAAPIADLGICYPVAVSRDRIIDNFSSSGSNFTSADCGALISACTDGVLCVWSRGSGHCRRRRKLPPWVGSPLIFQTLPSNPRHVCISCCFVDSTHLFSHDIVNAPEGLEDVGNEESQYRKPPKCTVVIVDSYTLSIVQTVFHGYLSIGPLKFMSVVTSQEDREKEYAMMIDFLGKSQLVPILKDSNVDGESVTGLHKSNFSSEITVQADGLTEWGKVVSVSACEKIFAFVYKSCCIFRLVDTGEKIGEIYFSDDLLILEDGSMHTDVMGGMILDDGDSKKLAVWNDRGSAIVYLISYKDGFFKFEPLCRIPSACGPYDVRSSFNFVQLNSFLLRVESVGFHVEEPFLWRPHITIWSPNLQVDDHLKLLQQCKMLGEGGFSVHRSVTCTPFSKVEDSSDIGTIDAKNDLVSRHSCIPKYDSVNNIRADKQNPGFVLKERIVSSSMVISETFGTPYAVVYGFGSGEIELVQFNMHFASLNHTNGNPHLEMGSNGSKRHFSGHTGAVLCLAAHEMVGTCKGWSFRKVLVSGSMDCTVRIWDLSSSNLITVMHQHVGPVQQIIFPPSKTERPWSDCFLSVGEDSCVALASLETLRVERMFPGHPTYPVKVAWDGPRGYVACISRNCMGTAEAVDVLFIWDVKTGARERVLWGAAAQSMFDHLCRSLDMNSTIDSSFNANTSASSLLLPIIEDASSSNIEKEASSPSSVPSIAYKNEPKLSQEYASKGNPTKTFLNKLSILQRIHHPIKCSSPFPGIATLSFDLALLMSFFQKHGSTLNSGQNPENSPMKGQSTQISSPRDKTIGDGSKLDGISIDAIEGPDWVRSLEECLLQFSLSFLHLWDVDFELDKLLITEMKLKKPDEFIVASGLQGDRGSLTVTFPDLAISLELWKSSSEFCAMRSLMMVSLAQCMISLSQTSSSASSALAAFYTRSFAEKIPDIKPPSLQLLVSFWQDESEHVRMAARSLFHCAASRAIPLSLCSPKAFKHAKFMSISNGMGENESKSNITEETPSKTSGSDGDESKILSWLESYEEQDWISCVGGTSQGAMTAHIIVAAALSIWYPSIVKPNLPILSVQPLMKLVMAMNEKYSCTAAELLAEGMESTWKSGIGSEIPRLMGDIFFQIECVTGQTLAASGTTRDILVGVLLPSLAMADIPGFLSVIESQIWSTASDSPVHLVSLMTLVRVARGSPKSLAQHLDKVVNFILQTMDPGNSVMRRTCLQSAMAALKEVARIFPMVALNEKSTRLAVGDAIGEVKNASIRIYDMQSVTKVKVLDASGPPGFPSLQAGAAEAMITTAISALAFSPDGEGLVAFSEQGLMVRWWSLGSVWWEKLSRNLHPVQCTKLIFVPPWEGFSPNSSRSSIMESIMGHDKLANSQELTKDSTNVDSLKLLIQNLDLSYHLKWVGSRKVILTRHGHELGTFLL